MKIRTIKIIFFSLLIGTFFYSCKTIKKITPDKKIENIKNIKKLSAVQLIQTVQSAQPAFQRAYVKKMSANLQAKGRELNVQTMCKMVRDSAIHLSIMPFMGIELFKIELTPKEMLVVDKMNKIFYKSNYGIFYELLGIDIDYDEIEALISNRLFVPTEKIIKLNDFSSANIPNQVALINKKNNFHQTTVINEQTGRIVTLLFKELKKQWTMKTDYSNFKEFDNLLFPQIIDMTANGSNEKIHFQFKIKEVLFDQQFSMREAKLRRYKQGNIKRLLKK